MAAMLLSAGELAANNLMQFVPAAPDATCGCTADEERYVSMNPLCRLRAF